jgi:hypothetical protein
MARSEEALLSIARKSLELPPDFGYHGSTPLGKTWGFSPFSVNRDSDALERSNYRRISEDLMAEFPREFRDERMNHWAVGWIDHLLVHVVDRQGHVTAAFRKAMEIQDKLDDYPVYDENDFSAIEYEESLQSLAHSWRFDADTDLRLAVEGEYPPSVAGDEILKDLIEALEIAQIQWGEGYGRYPTEEEWERAVLERWPDAYEKWRLGSTNWWSVIADALLHIEVVDLSRDDDREKLARHLQESFDAYRLEFPGSDLEYLLSDHRIRNLTTQHGDDRDRISKFLSDAIKERLGE